MDSGDLHGASDDLPCGTYLGFAISGSPQPHNAAQPRLEYQTCEGLADNHLTLGALGKYSGWNLPRIKSAYYCLGIEDKEGCARRLSLVYCMYRNRTEIG